MTRPDVDQPSIRPSTLAQGSEFDDLSHFRLRIWPRHFGGRDPIPRPKLPDRVGTSKIRTEAKIGDGSFEQSSISSLARTCSS